MLAHRKKVPTKPMDSPLLVGIGAVLALALLNAAAFNVPLIPVPAGNGQSVALGFGLAGIPLLALAGLALLFIRRHPRAR